MRMVMLALARAVSAVGPRHGPSSLTIGVRTISEADLGARMRILSGPWELAVWIDRGGRDATY